MTKSTRRSNNETGRRPMAPPSSADRWQTVKQEAVAVLAVAGSLTAALWLKRIIERLTTSKVIDPTVLQHGLAPAPATSQTPSPQPDASTPPSFLNLRPSVSRDFRSGPGRVYVPGHGY